MIIQYKGAKYQVGAVQTTICPAGTAYWLIQVHRVRSSHYNASTDRVDNDVDEDMALVTIDTGAIYGSPTLAHYIDRIKMAIDEFMAKVESIS